MFNLSKRREKEKPRAGQHQQAIAELHRLTRALPDPDGVIQLDELRQFLEFADGHHIDQDEVSDLWSDVRFELAQGVSISRLRRRCSSGLMRRPFWRLRSRS
jgi:hypothetical protein